MPLISPNSISVCLCQCSVWVVSGPASCSDITVIDPARSNTVLDQFNLPPTAPALCICAVPPIGQCQYNGLQRLPIDNMSNVFWTCDIPPTILTFYWKLKSQYCLFSFSFDTICLVLLCQVTLKELCGLGLRKEGRVCWISSPLQ